LELELNNNFSFNNSERISNEISNQNFTKNQSNQDMITTETNFSKKNSAESLFSRFIVKKISNMTSTITESNNDNYPIFSRSNTKPISGKTISFGNNENAKINNNEEIQIMNINELIMNHHNEVNINDSNKKSVSFEFDYANNLRNQLIKIENEGISKLKNKLSLKVKIPEDKSEKNNIDNSNSNNTNNVIDFENQANANLNENNEDLNLYNYNFSFNVNYNKFSIL